MIRKYRYGTPFNTEALTEKIETTEGVLPYGEVSQEEGFVFTYIMDEDDIVYGLGEANRGINKRGYCYISNCTDDPVHTEDKRSLYGAHNFIIVSGKTTFGLFFDYPSKLTFDIGYDREDTLRVSCENADLDIYVLEGENAYDIVKQFRHVIGRSYIPPKFAFGFGQSRWGYTTKEDFRTVAKGYRENHIPIDMIYMDIDYMQSFKDFTVNEENFPDFPEFVQEMDDQDIRLIPIIDAGVKVEPGYEIYEEGVKNNYFCKREDGSDFVAAVWPGDTHFPDMLNPEDYKRFYHNVDGKKIRHDKVHNLFGYNMTRAAGEAFERIDPEKRFLMFSRSSYIGMHRYGGIWTGDNKSWWSHILLNLKMLPSLNMCGFLYTGADLGGFGSDTTRELLLRFLALGVFTPLMRNHSATGTREQECYQFEKIEDFRAVINTRYRLVPYLYSEYMKAVLNDDMYFKPLGFVYPDDKRAIRIEDQLMLGNEIMIAPVYEQNARGRYVYLPEEMKFIKFLPDGSISEEVLAKGIHYVDVALNEVPLFIRSGKCIPVAEVAECVKDIDTEHLQLIGYKNSSYTMYEDDGIHKDYDKEENYRVFTN